MGYAVCDMGYTFCVRGCVSYRCLACLEIGGMFRNEGYVSFVMGGMSRNRGYVS